MICQINLETALGHKMLPLADGELLCYVGIKFIRKRKSHDYSLHFGKCKHGLKEKTKKISVNTEIGN